MDWVRGSSPGVALTCVSPQRIRATVNSQEQKRLLMDLDINMRTVDCFYTVTFYGALFREVRSVSAHLLPITAASLLLLCGVPGTLGVWELFPRCREHPAPPRQLSWDLERQAFLFLANSVPQIPCLKMKQVSEQVSSGCSQAPGAPWQLRFVFGALCFLLAL